MLEYHTKYQLSSVEQEGRLDMINRFLFSFFSILLFPLTVIMFLAPVLVFALPLFETHLLLMLTRIIIVLWLGVFITSAFFLSAYCGYFCPITKLFNLLARLLNDRNILSHRFPKVVGRVTRVLWVMSLVYVLVRFIGHHFGLLPKSDIYGHGEIIALFSLYTMASFISGTKVGRDQLGHYLCPLTTFIKVGIKINAVLNVIGFRIVVRPDRCIGCNACNRICSYLNDVRSMVESGSINYNVCSNCGKCISVCKHRAIKRDWSRPVKLSI